MEVYDDFTHPIDRLFSKVLKDERLIIDHPLKDYFYHVFRKYSTSDALKGDFKVLMGIVYDTFDELLDLNSSRFDLAAFKEIPLMTNYFKDKLPSIFPASFVPFSNTLKLVICDQRRDSVMDYLLKYVEIDKTPIEISFIITSIIFLQIAFTYLLLTLVPDPQHVTIEEYFKVAGIFIFLMNRYWRQFRTFKSVNITFLMIFLTSPMSNFIKSSEQIDRFEQRNSAIYYAKVLWILNTFAESLLNDTTIRKKMSLPLMFTIVPHLADIPQIPNLSFSEISKYVRHVFATVLDLNPSFLQLESFYSAKHILPIFSFYTQPPEGTSFVMLDETPDRLELLDALFLGSFPDGNLFLISNPTLQRLPFRAIPVDPAKVSIEVYDVKQKNVYAVPAPQSEINHLIGSKPLLANIPRFSTLLPHPNIEFEMIALIRGDQLKLQQSLLTAEFESLGQVIVIQYDEYASINLISSPDVSLKDIETIQRIIAEFE